MMKNNNNIITSILTAKTWTIFLIFMSPYLFLNIIPENTELFWGVLLSMFEFNIWFIWIIILGNELNSRLPDFLLKPSKIFNLSMAYVLTGFNLLMIKSYWISIKINPVILLVLIIIGLILLIYCLYFVARSLKELEKKRNVSASEYIPIIIWFSIILIGIWFVQPRIRNVVSNPEFKEGVK